jgi:hypothetical protein
VYLSVVASQRGDIHSETELNSCVRVRSLFSTWVALEISSHLCIPEICSGLMNLLRLDLKYHQK